MGHFPKKSFHDGRAAKAFLQLVNGFRHFRLRLFIFREQVALHLIGLELADRQAQEADGLMTSALIIQQHFTTFTLPRKLTKPVYTRPALSPLDFLRFGL